MANACSATTDAPVIVHSPFGGVIDRMFNMIDDHQVLNPVISHDAVDVVHHFVSVQLAAEMLFHNLTVLVDAPTSLGVKAPQVARRMGCAFGPVGIAIQFVTGAAAKLPVPSLDMRGANVEVFAASLAVA